MMINTNRPSDIRMAFGNPVKCEVPIGQCRLIKKIRDVGTKLEECQVEYLDDEEHSYDLLIKKYTDGKD